MKKIGRKMFNREKWTFQQDSAPAHGAKLTQNWLRENKIDYISKDDWPPSSPDLNPMDFSVWGILQERACKKPHALLEALKTSLMSEWKKIPQKMFADACSSVINRLEKCIIAGGGLFE